jgi:hypothetical protein
MLLNLDIDVKRILELMQLYNVSGLSLIMESSALIWQLRILR